MHMTFHDMVRVLHAKVLCHEEKLDNREFDSKTEAKGPGS